jgi:hypothetical protein
MDTDKKHIIQSDCDDEEGGGDQPLEQQQQRGMKVESEVNRCVLTALFLSLLAVITLTAFGVTTKLLLDATNSAMAEFNEQSPSGSGGGGRDAVVMSSDVQQNITDNHVTDLAKHQIVSTVSNYSRMLEIFKVENELSGKVICYVTPLTDKRRDATNDVLYTTRTQPGHDQDTTRTPPDPSAPPPFTPGNTVNAAWQTASYFNVIDTAISDISFLGSKGEEMCADVDTYWIIPAYPPVHRDGQIADYHVVVKHRDVFEDVGREVGRRSRRDAPMPRVPPPGASASRTIGKHGRPRRVRDASP